MPFEWRVSLLIEFPQGPALPQSVLDDEIRLVHLHRNGLRFVALSLYRGSLGSFSEPDQLLGIFELATVITTDLRDDIRRIFSPDLNPIDFHYVSILYI